MLRDEVFIVIAFDLTRVFSGKWAKIQSLEYSQVFQSSHMKNICSIIFQQN